MCTSCLSKIIKQTTRPYSASLVNVIQLTTPVTELSGSIQIQPYWSCSLRHSQGSLLLWDKFKTHKMLSRSPSVAFRHTCAYIFESSLPGLSLNMCPVFILTSYLKCSHHHELKSLLERSHLDPFHQESLLVVVWTLLRCLKVVCWVDDRISFGLERCKGKLKLGIESSSHDQVKAGVWTSPNRT